MTGMVRAAALILSGNAVAALLLLARNLIVARLIPVADYGIAATFATVMMLVEMMSALGLQQQIVQAKTGEDPHFQAALQGFQVLRGLIAGLALLALAGPIAAFLGVPEVAWAYRLVALVPVLNACVHFDIYRLNRQMRFWPVILTGAVPALVSVIALWPLSLIYGDYKVMLYAILVQAVLTVVTSHVVAERRFRLVLDRAIIADSLRFGWPLLVNGILLFAVFNGDKLIVGRELGMATLAIFAMGFTLTLTPTLVMAKSAQSFFLPQLSRLDQSTPDGRARFVHLALATMQVSLLNGALLVAGTALLGAPVVRLLLGGKYAALVPLLIALAILQAVRVAKTGGAVVALAGGHTGNAMLANLVRVATLPLAWYVLQQGGGLPQVIWIATMGEIGGYALSLWLVRRGLALSLRPMILPVALAAAFMVAAAVLPDWPGLPRWLPGVAMGLFFVAMLGVMVDLRRYVAQRRTIARGKR